jgi:hypothetical protein
MEIHDLKDDLGIPLGDPPRRSRSPAVAAGMHRLTVEATGDRYRARLVSENGHEATYDGLRGVVAWDGDDWTPIQPETDTLVCHERDQGDLHAQLTTDGVLRTWERHERPDPTVAIPSHILRERGTLSAMEATVHYLCDAPDGPELPQHEAADAVGTTRDQLWKQLRRARTKIEDEA